MKKPVVLPIVAVVGGLLGLAARQVQLRTAFEPGTGLPIQGSAASYALWGVLLLTALVLFVLSQGKHRTFEKCYTSAFGTTSMVWLSGELAGAALLVLAGFCSVEAFVSAPIDEFTAAKTVSIFRPILGVACLAAAAGIWFTVQATRSGRRQTESLWLLMPGVVGCLWVLCNYQTWAQEPVMEHYFCLMLVALVAMVTCVSAAGFAFGKGKVSGTVFGCFFGGCLCIVSLCDGLALCDVALLLGMGFYLLSMGGILLTNDAKPEPPAGAPACGGTCQGCPGCGPAPAAPDAPAAEAPAAPSNEQP